MYIENISCTASRIDITLILNLYSTCNLQFLKIAWRPVNTSTKERRKEKINNRNTMPLSDEMRMNLTVIFSSHDYNQVARILGYMYSEIAYNLN